MRKSLIILLIILIASPLVLFAAISNAFPQYILGYVGVKAAFNASLNTEVLPFDIESVSVAQNTVTTNVRGLLIGHYTLNSNSDFTLTISHDKLTCQNASELDKQNNTPQEADYRLDVFYYNPSSLFKTGYDGDEIEISQEDFRTIPDYAMGNYEIDCAFYVSMRDSSEDLAKLAAGNYQSTITFEFEVGA